MIISHFWHNDIDMAFISLTHWHAIGTFEQATKDMIRRFRPSLRRYVQFGCVMICVIKAKFHYASWFEAGSKLVADQLRTR